MALVFSGVFWWRLTEIGMSHSRNSKPPSKQRNPKVKTTGEMALRKRMPTLCSRTREGEIIDSLQRRWPQATLTSASCPINSSPRCAGSNTRTSRPELLAKLLGDEIKVRSKRNLRAAGISRNSMYAHLRRDSGFRRRWERALNRGFESRYPISAALRVRGTSAPTPRR